MIKISLAVRLFAEEVNNDIERSVQVHVPRYVHIPFYMYIQIQRIADLVQFGIDFTQTKLRLGYRVPGHLSFV